MQDPATLLSDVLVERKSKNPNYSARALARDLGISISFLSQIINKKRNLSLIQKVKLAEHLGIETSRLFNSLSLGKNSGKKAKSKNKNLDLVQATIEHEKIIKHWYHFAILELISTGKIKNNPSMVARRLGISTLEAKVAIARLCEYEYIEVTEAGNLKDTALPFMIQIKSGNPAVREYYSSRLRAAEQELLNHQEARVESRYYQNLFITTTKTRAAKAKTLISKFQENLIHYLIGDKGKTEDDEVYQLSLQLFSIEKQKE